ncbi:MAG: threonylcarbamoyl-AMP synthase [Rickettsiales bacterium]|nr:threonylcarbamoyl-AMP synthase [Rickettsiales bacterium]OUV53392.1 MAG: threonylcarbamoyl-AMP synthase [Rickettsiales bacterium TMED127]
MEKTLSLQKESVLSIKSALEFLAKGQLISVATETVYGLVGDSSNSESINKIYKLKKRPTNNPLIIHVNSIEMAKKISHFNRDAVTLAKCFWPGPLTLILNVKKNKLVCSKAIANLRTIAVRMPQKKIFLEIIKRFNKPLAAPSANMSGYISPTKAEHVNDSFKNNLGVIIDSGKCKYGLESTIVNLAKKPYKIERIGIIDEHNIFSKTKLNVKGFKKSKLLISPGQLKHHYSPNTPIELNVKIPVKDTAFLSFGLDYDSSIENSLNLSRKGSLSEAAFNLFDYMRRLDKLNLKKILVSPIPNKGIGIVINEKLKKASFKK